MIYYHSLINKIKLGKLPLAKVERRALWDVMLMGNLLLLLWYHWVTSHHPVTGYLPITAHLNFVLYLIYISLSNNNYSSKTKAYSYIKSLPVRGTPKPKSNVIADDVMSHVLE